MSAKKRPKQEQQEEERRRRSSLKPIDRPEPPDPLAAQMMAGVDPTLVVNVQALDPS